MTKYHKQTWPADTHTEHPYIVAGHVARYECQVIVTDDERDVRKKYSCL